MLCVADLCYLFFCFACCLGGRVLSVLSVFHISYCAWLFTMCAVVYFAMYACILLFIACFACVFYVSMLFDILTCCMPYYLTCYLSGLVLFWLLVLRFPCLFSIVVGWHVCNLWTTSNCLYCPGHAVRLKIHCVSVEGYVALHRVLRMTCAVLSCI
jgi:hypothetical protein